MFSILRSRIVIYHLLAVIAVFAARDISSLIVNRGDFSPFSSGALRPRWLAEETRNAAAQAKHFATRGSLFTEIDVYELRAKPNGVPVILSFLAGVAGFVTQNLEQIWMLSHVLVAAFLWLCCFAILIKFGGSEGLTAAFSWWFLLVGFVDAHQLFSGEPLRILLERTQTLPHPLFSFALFLWVTSRILLALKEAKKFKSLGAGLALGFLFYANYYYWFALFIGSVLLAGLFVFRRENAKARPILAITFLSFLIACPYLLVVLTLPKELKANLLARLLDPYEPLGSPGGIIICLLGMLSLWLLESRMFRQLTWKEKKAYVIVIFLFIATAAGAGIGLNAPLVLGFASQGAKQLGQYLMQPLLVLLLLGLTAHLVKRFEKIPHLSYVTLGFALVAGGILTWGRISTGIDLAPGLKKSDPHVQLLQWVRGNIPHQSVVGTSEPLLISLMPTIAGNWNFLPCGLRSVASNSEIVNRFAILSKLEALTETEMERRLKVHPGTDPPWMQLAYVLFGNNYPDPDLKKEIRGQFRTFNAMKDFPRELVGRRLDYLILPKSTPLSVVEVTFKEVRAIHTIADWQIIRVGQPKI